MTEVLREIPQALWGETPGNVFRTDLTTKRFEELNRLKKRAVAMGSVCLISYGAQISSKKKGAFGRDQFLSKDPARMAKPKRFYEGSDMRPFGMTWDGTYVDMGHSEEMYGPRTPQFFAAPKLSIRHISGDSDTFVTWVDEDGYYTDHGVIHAVPYCALSQDAPYDITDEQRDRAALYPLFYLLGIIMSRPARELYAELYATGSLQGAFSHVYPNMVKGLPIPKLKKAPEDAPEGWVQQLEELGARGKISRTAIKRVFRKRSEMSSGLTAAARERQRLEGERQKRELDFATFMQIHSPGWSWKRGESLESPPPESEFLARIGKSMISLEAAGLVRSEFQSSVALAASSATKAGLLQRAIDGLAAALYT